MESTPSDRESAAVAATRGRPALAEGEHGDITTSQWVKDPTTGKARRKRSGDSSGRRKLAILYWTAEAYAKQPDPDGKVVRRRLQARGKSEAEAKANLQTKLNPPEADHLAEALAAEVGHATSFTNKATLGEVLDAWVSDRSTVNTRSVGTLVRYRHAIDSTIKARKVGRQTLGTVPLDKVTPRVLTLFLASLSPSVAKTCRGILRQALTYAVANGATVPTTNGSFAMLSQRIERAVSSPTSPTVAITKTEAEQIITDLLSDERTKGTDLPDLFRFLAGTGCRTSEATALAWSQLDLESEPPTVLIDATVNGAGQRQTHTKTRAGVRRLTLPQAVVAMLKARQVKAKEGSSLVFPSSRRRNADREETPYWSSNITGVIRTELDRLGHTGVTARSFRKMVATELDKAGYAPRQIADQLGHSRPSVTMDVYQNREAAGPASVVDVL